MLCIALMLTCSGCFTVMEKAGQILDRSAFAGKKIAVYRAQQDGENMEIALVQGDGLFYSVTFAKFPEMKLNTGTPDGNNIILESMDFLASNRHGWNEFRLGFTGAGTFVLNGDTAILSIPWMEAVQISSGRIHRYDTRITGTEAVTALNNRRERIVSLCRWMKGDEPPENISLKDFEKLWKPVLFPELVSKNKRPAQWSAETDEWERAEDINWNIGYTARTFPEELRMVRNSGTMLRDWEEALAWIYFEYEWENTAAVLSGETVFKRIK
jgi:hypothetical protein